MCTLVMLFQQRIDIPLIVAANRDEFFARPATSPARVPHPDASVHITAGVDLERGGTWMGVERTGFFVGLTNQRPTKPLDTSLRSRGEIVMNALALRNPAKVRAMLDALDGREWNPFNLAFGNAHELVVAYARTETRSIETHALSPGVWVLPNDVVESTQFPKVHRAHELLPADLRSLPHESLISSLQSVLADHQLTTEDPHPQHDTAGMTPDFVRQLSALCVHTPRYGTRSASIIGLRDGGVAFYRYAPGPPCSSRFDSVSD